MLLTFLVNVFSSVDLSMPSEIATNRNDMTYFRVFGLSGKDRC